MPKHDHRTKHRVQLVLMPVPDQCMFGRQWCLELGSGMCRPRNHQPSLNTRARTKSTDVHEPQRTRVRAHQSRESEREIKRARHKERKARYQRTKRHWQSWKTCPRHNLRKQQPPKLDSELEPRLECNHVPLQSKRDGRACYLPRHNMPNKNINDNKL